MRILIDASSLKSAGGLNVGLAVLEEIVENIDKFQKVIVIIPDNKAYEEISHDKVDYVKITNKIHFSLFKLFNGIFVNRLIKTYNIDLVFNLCNFPYRTKGVKFIQFLHWPYAVYNDEELNIKVDFTTNLKRKLKKNIFLLRRNLPDRYIVQTSTIKNRLALKIDQNIPIDIAKSKLHLPSVSEIKNPSDSEKQDEILRFFYPSRYYTHKNIEILIDVAVILKQKSFPCKIYITIEESHHKNVSSILNAVKSLQIEDYLINLGTLEKDNLDKQYQLSDVIIMPTLLETLGLPYLEAMHYKKPVMTSDLGFSREVCGDYAKYFNPKDAKDIVKAIKEFLNGNRMTREELDRNNKLEDFNKGKEHIINILTREIK